MQLANCTLHSRHESSVSSGYELHSLITPTILNSEQFSGPYGKLPFFWIYSRILARFLFSTKEEIHYRGWSDDEICLLRKIGHSVYHNFRALLLMTIARFRTKLLRRKIKIEFPLTRRPGSSYYSWKNRENKTVPNSIVYFATQNRLKAVHIVNRSREMNYIAINWSSYVLYSWFWILFSIWPICERVYMKELWIYL